MAKTYKAKILGTNGNEMQTGKVRLSFPHLFEKYPPNDKNPKYQCTLLVDKDDKPTVTTIKKAIEVAKELGKTTKWGGKIPSNLAAPFHDGDDKEYDGYEDHYYVTARSTRQPKVTDETGDEIFDQDDIYAGCYVRAVIAFYPYNSEGKKGIGCILERVQKVDDGEPFGGSGGSNFEDEDDDDEDLGL